MKKPLKCLSTIESESIVLKFLSKKFRTMNFCNLMLNIKRLIMKRALCFLKQTAYLANMLIID